MPSILAKADRRVLRFFHKYGFNNVNLTLYLMDSNATTEMAIELEQYFIDTLSPDLNVDLVAASSGYHEPMSMEMRQNFRKLRGIPIYVYDTLRGSLVHMFDSKTHLFESMRMDHRALEGLLNTENPKPYLNRYLFSLTTHPELSVDDMMSLDNFLLELEETRRNYERNSDKMKPVYAENVKDSNLSKYYPSLTACVTALKADRKTVRDYLNGVGAKSLFRGQWKFTWVDKNE
jgi:hypothetical protein